MRCRAESRRQLQEKTVLPGQEQMGRRGKDTPINV